MKPAPYLTAPERLVSHTERIVGMVENTLHVAIVKKLYLRGYKDWYSCLIGRNMTDNDHATTIIEDTLDVSYEPQHEWVSDDGGTEISPAEAVLLLTRCCARNHEHISLNHSQAAVLAQWLDDFVKGEYDE
jgi:hypothetical protein